MRIEGLEVTDISRRGPPARRWIAATSLVVSVVLLVAAAGMELSEHVLRRNLRIASMAFFILSYIPLLRSQSPLLRGCFFAALVALVALAAYWIEVS